MAVIYVSFYFLFARQLPQHGEYRFSCGKMLIIMLVAMLSSVVMGSIGKALYDKNHTVIFRLVLVYDLLLSLCLLAMLLLHKMGEQVRATCIEEKHLHLLHQQQYELMQETIETINHKCHDLKHQISLLRSENSALNRERIFQELERDIMIYDSHIHTGNTSLDELLTEKFLHCDRLGVQWTCMADGKVVTFIDPIDLYTLLGNALENAIESAMKVDPIDKRFLSVNILRKGNMVLIRIENYCQQNLVFYDGLPVTTKPNQSEHGFGMRSIQNITQRYHGELNVHMEGEQFKLSILIPIPNDIDE
ncbi:MAG: ATP-binding protein [bacterium]|nr:ATP-binding protein [bacterium]